MRASNVLRGFDDDMREGRARGDDARRRRASLRHPAARASRSVPTARFASTLTDGEMIDVDQVLVATGRLPNTRGLGLETAGVALSQHGAIKVDDHLTSAVPSIHAVGDVTHRVNLTPVAIREGHALADRLFGPGAKPIRYDTIAHVVFGTPELGAVGLTEAEARPALSQGRRLYVGLPADEGDALGQRRAHDHEARRRRSDGADPRRASSRP